MEETERCAAGEHDARVEAQNLDMHGKLETDMFRFLSQKGVRFSAWDIFQTQRLYTTINLKIQKADIRITKTNKKTKNMLQGQTENALQHVNGFFFGGKLDKKVNS